MERENILITENYTTKKVAATKFTTGGVPAFDYSIHFGKEGNDVTLQNCHVKDNAIVKCSPEDTYDFETGALIALMKMCGVEKVVRAFNEVFPKERYNTYVAKLEGKLHELKKDFDKVKDLKDFYKKNYNESLEEIKRLKTEKHMIIAAKNVLYNNLEKENQKKQDRINELERGYKASNDDKAKLVEYYQKEIKDLEGNIDELFESEQHTKTELGRLYFEKHRLEEENEKLKLDCEKLQHGYIDTDMIFCGGRQNGKQYIFLVDLFKKIDQKKVDAAYKEAFNTTLPVWQKEALRQVYEIRKESKEKTELPRTLDINGTTYLKSFQIIKHNDSVDSLIEESRAFTRKCVDEWLYGPSTKREEMWNEIFAIHKVKHPIIVVKKEDINTFFHELENKNPEITWASGVKIFEGKGTIKDIYVELKRCDTIYFRLQKSNKLSYSTDPYIYPYYEFEHIPYLPPMRWDLFKKGRKIVRVTPENIDDFIVKCTNKFGAIMKPNLKRYKDSTHAFIMISDYHYDNKPAIHIMTPEDLVRNQHENPKKYSDKKIVDWEDVR